MGNKIVLGFDKSLITLAGNRYGRKIFTDQVKDKIVYDKDITFVFPEHIKSIASSFIQGFFKEIVDEIGINGIEKNVELDSSIDDLKTYVIKSLLIMR